MLFQSLRGFQLSFDKMGDALSLTAFHCGLQGVGRMPHNGARGVGGCANMADNFKNLRVVGRQFVVSVAETAFAVFDRRSNIQSRGLGYARHCCQVVKLEKCL